MHTALLILGATLNTILVSGLGSEDFTTRETCAKSLAARGWQTRSALEAGLNSSDAEISRTSYMIWNDLLELQIDTYRDHKGDLPEIDGAWYDLDDEAYSSDLYYPRYEVMVGYLDAIGRDGYPWVNYRLATHLWMRAELGAGVTTADMHLMIDEMRFRDEVFLSHYKDKHPESDK